MSWVKSGGCSGSTCPKSLAVPVIQSYTEKYMEKALGAPELCSALLCSAQQTWQDWGGRQAPSAGSSLLEYLFSARFTLNRYDKKIIREALQFVRCLVRTTFLLLLLLLGLTGWFALA